MRAIRWPTEAHSSNDMSKLRSSTTRLARAPFTDLEDSDEIIMTVIARNPSRTSSRPDRLSLVGRSSIAPGGVVNFVRCQQTGDNAVSGHVQRHLRLRGQAASFIASKAVCRHSD